jgi:hypothetical protein
VVQDDDDQLGAADRAPQDFEGNGYVSVQFLRDPSSDELFMSPLSCGVAAFAPNLTARTQPIELEVPADQARRHTDHPRDAREASRRGAGRGRGSCRLPATGTLIRSDSSSEADVRVETRQILDLILPDFNVSWHLRLLAAAPMAALPGS